MARTIVESLGIEFLFKGTANVKQAQNAQHVIQDLMTGISKLIGAAGGMYAITGAISPSCKKRQITEPFRSNSRRLFSTGRHGPQTTIHSIW